MSAAQRQRRTSTARKDARSGSHIVSGPSSGTAAAAQRSSTQPKPAEPPATFKPIPSRYRDALTGAPLMRGRDTRLWRTYDRLDNSETGEPGRDVPTHLDTSRPYPVNASEAGEHASQRRDYLGGLEWTPQAYRYFRHVMPRGIAYARLVWREWWRAPGVVDDLALRFRADKLEAVLCWLRDGEDFHAVAARIRKTPDTLRRWKSQIVKVVREEYLSPELLDTIGDFARMLDRMEQERASHSEY